jgi:hypothetical protein
MPILWGTIHGASQLPTTCDVSRLILQKVKISFPIRPNYSARHWGNSATFGCPYGDCTFTTKSSKFFREHLSKHQTVLASRAASGYSFAMPFKIDLGNIATFMINDECGIPLILLYEAHY